MTLRLRWSILKSRLRNYFYYRWPLVSRKRHEAEMRNARFDAEARIKTEREKIATIADNFHEIRFHTDRNRGRGLRFGVEVNLSEEMLFGMRDLKEAVPYIADNIAAKVRQELLRVDFARFKPDDLIVRASERYRSDRLSQIVHEPALNGGPDNGTA